MAWLFRYKPFVLCLLGALFSFLAATVFLTPLKEDITFFLPDDPELADQFSVFSLTPPARLIFLELSAASPEAVPLLDDAVRALRSKLAPPLFTAVHPAAAMPRAAQLMDLVPSLIDTDETGRYMAAARPEALAETLPLLKDKLLGLQGIVLKEFVPSDPLGMLGVLFERLRRTGLMPEKKASGPATPALGAMTLENGLVSPDGTARLLFAETPLNSMDAHGAIAISAALDDLAGNMPAGVTMHAISAHQQTAANVQTIRADMSRVLSASIVALCLIFLIWLRTLSSLPALALPAFALLGAWGLMALAGVRISGITLGFGAVLLGIVVDYALHVHCAMRAGVNPQAAAETLFRPLGFSFLTTAGAVSVLFFSDLPGMRQVGLFSLLGCASGLVLALFALPLLHRVEQKQACIFAPPPEKDAPPSPPAGAPSLRIRPLPFCLFAFCAGLALWAGRGVDIQGNLRSLGVQDPSLVRAEQEFTRRWGQGFRRSAMLVSRAPGTEKALSVASQSLDELRLKLRDKGGLEWVVTPLPLIPPPAEQNASRNLWRRFVGASCESLNQNLGPDSAATRLGFADTAFAPFLNELEAPPLPITAGVLDQAGFGLIRALFLPLVDFDGKPGRAVLSLVPDDPGLRAAAKNLPAGSVIFSPTGIAERVGADVRADFSRMGLFALAAVALCLALALRSVKGFLLACVPSLSGSAALLLVFGLGGHPMNMFTVAAVPLVMGLCAEYGIFMTRHMASPDAASTPKAILLSGLTTLTGFGSLVLADHPALHTLGLTVGVGIGVAIPASLWLLPFLAGRGMRR